MGLHGCIPIYASYTPDFDRLRFIHSNLRERLPNLPKYHNHLDIAVIYLRVSPHTPSVGREAWPQQRTLYSMAHVRNLNIELRHVWLRRGFDRESRKN